MRIKYKKIIAAVFVVFCLVLFVQLSALPVFAQYKIITGIPGSNVVTSGQSAQNVTLQQYVKEIYLFAFAIVGLLALGSIVFHAVVYTMSAGNASKMQDAMGGIKDALWGLLLLIFAYLILWTINPNLVTLGSFDVPDITGVKSSGSANAGGGGLPPQGSTLCSAGYPCVTLSGCNNGVISCPSGPNGTEVCSVPAGQTCNAPPSQGYKCRAVTTNCGTVTSGQTYQNSSCGGACTSGWLSSSCPDPGNISTPPSCVTFAP